MGKKPIKPPESYLDMPFPAKGIDLSRGFGMQQPGTTPEGQNVRAFEPATMRARGGQRPGLQRYVAAQVGGTVLVQELAVVVGVGYTPPGPGTGVVSMPQAPTRAATGSATLTITLPKSVTAGNATIVATADYAGFPTVTDQAGNTYTRIVNSSVDFTAASIFYSMNVRGGFNAVTVAFANGIANAAFVFEVAGLSLTQGDGTGTSQGIGAVTGTFGSFTRAQAGDLAIGVVGTSGGIATMTTPGYASIYYPDTHFLAIYQPSMGIGTDNPAFSLSHAAEYSSCIAAFKKAS